MIVKERKIPMKILKLEALLRRLPSEHLKRFHIEEELAISKAGFRGEQTIDYYFGFIPTEDYLIFNDLRLSIRNRFFQIDSLLLTASYILIIELKNIAGTIWFDETFQQMIRIQEGKEERFPNPILQTARQKLQLQEWLAKYNYQKIPVHTVTVFTNNKSIIKSSSSNPHLTQQVIQVEEFLAFLEKMNDKKVLTNNDLQNLSMLFMTNHIPSDIDVLQHFQIEKNELMSGVQCPHCSAIPMIRNLRKWQCSVCLKFSHNAHLASIQDYALLLHSTITNQELRHFLHISCQQLAYYLLRSMKLSSSGHKKGTVWHINI